MGGVAPTFPRRFGAQAGRLEEVLFRSLCETDGTALANPFTPLPTLGAPLVASYNQAEHFAEARCLAYLFGLSDLLANQWDFARVTFFLPRWEAIFGIAPPVGAQLSDRRTALQAKLAAWGLPAYQHVVNDLLTTLLGAYGVGDGIYVGLVNTSSAQTGQQTTPGGQTVACGASIPGGLTLSSGAVLPDGPWASVVSNLLLQVKQPAGMLASIYYALVGSAWQYLDALMPCWTTFTIARLSANGPGLWLDDPNNLDNEAFRV